jgi:hypothetical protein
MAGYLIGVITFVVALFLGASRLGRPRVVLVFGAVLAGAWMAAGAVTRANEVEQGHEVLPLWFLGALVALLYAIWCGGLWVGVRLRRSRSG